MGKIRDLRPQIADPWAKLKTAIQMERKSFELEREKMAQMITEMAKFTREQKEVSNNERIRNES